MQTLGEQTKKLFKIFSLKNTEILKTLQGKRLLLQRLPYYLSFCMFTNQMYYHIMNNNYQTQEMFYNASFAFLVFALQLNQHHKFKVLNNGILVSMH